MPESESEQGFRVNDRRGRRADEEAERRPVAPPAGPPAGGLREAAAPRIVEASPGEVPPTPPAGERSLVGLFMMLASLAAASLEGVPDPATGRVERDPGQAAEIIDLLLLLREKTEGRRTPEENQALDEVVYELQLGYVRATTGRPG
jgi:hypothetical protein